MSGSKDAVALLRFATPKRVIFDSELPAMN